MIDAPAKAVTVGTTATQLTTSSKRNSAILIYNNSSNTVYLGNSSVTTTNGYPLSAGADFAIDATAFGIEGETLPDIYGIASAASEVRVWEWEKKFE